MQIEINNTFINDVIVVKPEILNDERGFFSEIYRKDQYELAGLPCNFVQMNQAGSVRNVLRGLHFQWDPPMGKLMRVVIGTAYLVAVDIRHGSPTLGNWIGFKVSAENKLNIWAPAGFARGYCVLSEYAEIQYLCTGIYNGETESGILWNDPEIGIDWQINEPVLSDKDKTAQSLHDWLTTTESRYFIYKGEV